MDPLFEIKVKQAFSKVKEDMNFIKQELSELRALIKELSNKVSPIEKDTTRLKSTNFDHIQGNQQNKDNTSIGNKGAYSFTHSLIHSPFTHLNTHSNTKSDKNQDLTLTNQESPQPLQKQNTRPDITLPFQTLTNREFLVFLTIYQLEKESPRVTYIDVANKLTLTSGCIRSYISSLIKKKVPLIKHKINNKIVTLSIDKSFRSLTSEQKLINLFYQNDPYQSTLS